jgi:hypothetical protein
LPESTEGKRMRCPDERQNTSPSDPSAADHVSPSWLTLKTVPQTW